MHRAGGIDEPSSRRQQGQHALEQLPLEGHQLLDGLGGEAPAGVRMPRQGAEPGAGGIHQDAIKPPPPLGSLLPQASGIGREGADRRQSQAFGIALQPPQPGVGAIHRPDLALIAHELRQMGALAAGGGAGIQDPLAGPGLQQRGDALGAAVLHAPEPLRIARQVAEIAAALQQGEAVGHLRQGPGGDAGRREALQQSLAAGRAGD